jgi:outer membrane protein assembly factor BamD (BamD/ComL family)
LGGSAQALASMMLSDPELDAERIYTLSQAERSAKVEAEMFQSIEWLVSTYPQSPWAEQALFDAGNYYWVTRDRDLAVEYYQRVVSAFAAGRRLSTADRPLPRVQCRHGISRGQLQSAEEGEDAAAGGDL